jgi:adenine phosphoribosyltransferase
VPSVFAGGTSGSYYPGCMVRQAGEVDGTAVDGTAVDLTSFVRDVPDWPRPGVTFKDITPLLGDAGALHAAIEGVTAAFAGVPVDKVLGIEARGFIFAAPVALALGAGFVPVRKAGKLPWHVEAEHYDLEYGTDRLEIHRDAVASGERVLIVDDVLATGGTAAATAALAGRLGGTVVGLGFVLELEFLSGRSKLAGHDVASLVSYA